MAVRELSVSLWNRARRQAELARMTEEVALDAETHGPLAGMSASDYLPARIGHGPRGRTRLNAVGAPRFELGTSSPPDWRANQAAPRPVRRPD